jgi:plasmid stabilization system protein ParE
VNRTVTIAPGAAVALREARLWLTQKGSGIDGRRRWEELKNARRRLREWPYIGALSQEHAGHRQLVVSGYRILYFVEHDTGDSQTAGNIRMVAVFGPGQR